jgi:hypothetical protein
MRDHVAIAKKAARTRARMKATRTKDAQREYDAKRRREAVKRAAWKLVAIQAGYEAWAAQYRRKSA